MARTMIKLGRADDDETLCRFGLRAWKWAGDSKNLHSGDEKNAVMTGSTLRPRSTASLAILPIRFIQARLVIRSPNDMLFIWQQQEQTLGVWTFAWLRTICRDWTRNFAKCCKGGHQLCKGEVRRDQCKTWQ